MIVDFLVDLLGLLLPQALTEELGAWRIRPATRGLNLEPNPAGLNRSMQRDGRILSWGAKG